MSDLPRLVYPPARLSRTPVYHACAICELSLAAPRTIPGAWPICTGCQEERVARFGPNWRWDDVGEDPELEREIERDAAEATGTLLVVVLPRNATPPPASEDDDDLFDAPFRPCTRSLATE